MLSLPVVLVPLYVGQRLVLFIRLGHRGNELRDPLHTRPLADNYGHNLFEIKLSPPSTYIIIPTVRRLM